MRKGVIHRLILTIVSVLVLAGCQYKELCYDHSHIVDLDVKYDWSGVEDADEAQPLGMSAYFYGGRFVGTRAGAENRYDIGGKNGGKVRIEWGKYQVLGLNFDTEAILFRYTDDPMTFEAYTRGSSLEEGTLMSTKVAMPKATGTEQQRVALEPDMLWAGLGDEFEVAMGEKNASTTIHLAQRVAHFKIVIENVPNLQYTSQFGGSMSGMAGAVNLATGELSDECVIHSFPVRKEGPTTLVAEFNSFGHCPHVELDSVNEHMLTIYAILADGQKWYYTVDVTKQIHDPVQNPDEHNIVVVVDELPVPKPIVNGSGFKPDIDGWEGEEIIVEM